MHHTRLLFIIVFAIFLGFLSALVVASNKLIVIPSLQKQTENTFVKVDTVKEEKISTNLIDKVLDAETTISDVSEKQDKLEEEITKLKKSVDAGNKSTDIPVGKTIYSYGRATSGSFATGSNAYAAMGLYVNLSCPVDCNLWINFSATTKNNSNGYINSYELFIDGSDQSTGTEVNLPDANNSSPIAVNALIGVGAGTHTVEIRTKTTGGTLESRNSYLQVMSLEK